MSPLMMFFEIVGEPLSIIIADPPALGEAVIELLLNFGDALVMEIETESRTEFSIMQPEPVCSFQLVLSDVKAMVRSEKNIVGVTASRI